MAVDVVMPQMGESIFDCHGSRADSGARSRCGQTASHALSGCCARKACLGAFPRGTRDGGPTRVRRGADSLVAVGPPSRKGTRR